MERTQQASPKPIPRVLPSTASASKPPFFNSLQPPLSQSQPSISPYTAHKAIQPSLNPSGRTNQGQYQTSQKEPSMQESLLSPRSQAIPNRTIQGLSPAPLQGTSQVKPQSAARHQPQLESKPRSQSQGQIHIAHGQFIPPNRQANVIQPQPAEVDSNGFPVLRHRKDFTSPEPKPGVIHNQPVRDKQETNFVNRLHRTVSVIQDFPEDKLYPPNGKIIRKYKLIKTLGTGGFALVKKALDLETKKHVAIKIFSKSGEAFNARLISNEVMVMKKISHPNIISFICALEDTNYIYIVMEYADGGDLLRLAMKMGRLPDDISRHIFSQVVSAITYLKKMNITHRDLKLENILLSSSQQLTVKLSDFGMVGVCDPKVMLRTICGTPVYNPPEVLDLKPYYGPPVDIWSLGVILYSMLCGNFPFDDLEDIQLLYKKIRQGIYPAPTCDRLAKDLISKMLVVNPSSRLSIEEVESHPWMQTREKTTITREVVLQKLKDSYHSPFYQKPSLYKPVPTPLLNKHPIESNPRRDTQIQLNPKPLIKVEREKETNTRPPQYESKRPNSDAQDSTKIVPEVNYTTGPSHDSTPKIPSPVIIPPVGQSITSPRLLNQQQIPQQKVPSISKPAVYQPDELISPDSKRYWVWSSQLRNSDEDEMFSDSSDDDESESDGYNPSPQVDLVPFSLGKPEEPSLTHSSKVNQGDSLGMLSLPASSLSPPVRIFDQPAQKFEWKFLKPIEDSSGKDKTSRSNSSDGTSTPPNSSSTDISPSTTRTARSNTNDYFQYNFRRDATHSNPGSIHETVNPTVQETSQGNESNSTNESQTSALSKQSRGRITRKLTREWPSIDYAENQVPLPCCILLLKINDQDDETKREYINHYLAGLEGCIQLKKGNEEWLLFYLNSVMVLLCYVEKTASSLSFFKSTCDNLMKVKENLEDMIMDYIDGISCISPSQKSASLNLKETCQWLQKKLNVLLSHKMPSNAIEHWFLHMYKHINAMLLNAYLRTPALCCFTVAADMKGQVSMLVLWLFRSLPKSFGLELISAQLQHTNDAINLLTCEKTETALRSLQTKSISNRQKWQILSQFQKDYIDDAQIPKSYLSHLASTDSEPMMKMELAMWDLRLWKDYPPLAKLPVFEGLQHLYSEKDWVKTSGLLDWIRSPAS